MTSIAEFVGASRHYMRLAYYMALFSLKRQSFGTYLGAIWWFTDPVVNTAVYYFLIVVIFKARGEEFVQFLLVGLFIWRWFQSCTSNCANAIMSNASLTRQVHLPKALFVVKEVMQQTVMFGFAMVILLSFLYISGVRFDHTMLYFPLMIAAGLIVISGFGFLFASVVPFFPDLRVLINYGLRIGMFMSGTFFDGSRIPEEFRGIYYANPMAHLIEAFRAVLLFNETPDMLGLLYASTFGAVLGTVGFIILRRNDRVYPRIVG